MAQSYLDSAGNVNTAVATRLGRLIVMRTLDG